MRQPPENSMRARFCAGSSKPRPARIAGGARRRGMGVDIDETGLDFGDAQRIARLLGFGQEGGALAVGGEHEVDQAARAARRLLLDPADAGLTGNRDRAAFRADFACDQAKQRGLAGAVAPDQTDVRAGRQRRARLIDQQAFAEAIGEIVDMQHAGAFGAARRARQGAAGGAIGRACGSSPRPLTPPLPDKRATVCTHLSVAGGHIGPSPSSRFAAAPLRFARYTRTNASRSP